MFEATFVDDEALFIAAASAVTLKEHVSVLIKLVTATFSSQCF